MAVIPAIRITPCNDAPLRSDGEFVLYWMIAARRPGWSFALQRAVEHARELGVPLVVLEALGCSYRWASDRIHAFVIEGMVANQRAFARRPVTYYPYVEPEAGAGKGLVDALARRACCVVTDDFPCFELPRYVAAVAARSPVLVEKIDGNGLLPMRAADKVFARAHDFRRFLQRTLSDHFEDFPVEDPLARVRLPRLEALPEDVTARWVPTDLKAVDIGALPIDHEVLPGPNVQGGSAAAHEMLLEFLGSRLGSYGEERNSAARTTSALSPYLHFGHISSHEIFAEIALREAWDPSKVSTLVDGRRAGWWGMSPPAEAFLDQLLTWRELGFNMCWQRDDYDRYESLPDWARATLEEHATDPREYVYDLAEFEQAQTHDEIWNAAQRQLVQTGRMHNYLRMLWAKKILEWSASPREALDVMIELNNKFALDGRNPNSYSGIFWCLGRYDRAWGPERPIFGKIRYMSSDSTRRKLKLTDYLAEFGAEASAPGLFDRS